MTGRQLVVIALAVLVALCGLGLLIGFPLGTVGGNALIGLGLLATAIALVLMAA